MIKLIIIARCIPEDVYLRSLEQPAPVLAGEKKFSVVVRDPESWYIGRLAIEIKNRYESIYKRPFGQIKYLKEADDDCDLDPELSVADLLVDEGKAARDGADQKRIVKVIQEQGRALRQGSVIPDLTPIHYQPPTRPPVPKFPAPEKRTTEDQNVDDRPSKRRRLGQIEEEGQDDILSSIEGNALNGNLDHASIEPKQESPELARTWVNTAPATRDELELLPEAPANFQLRGQRTGLPVSTSRQNHGPEIGEPSAPPPEDQQNHRTPGPSRERERLADRFARQQSLANAETPITPPGSGNQTHTPGGQAVSMLNGMKSASPALRQSTSSSANKFRKTKKTIYDFDESDIDDTQMSPRSRALRTKITPKLVPNPHSRSSGDATSKSVGSASSGRRSGASNAMEVDSNKENQKVASKQENGIPRSRYQHQGSAMGGAQDSKSPSWERDGFSKLPPMPNVPSKCPRQNSDSTPADRNSTLGTDETSSVQGDSTRKKKKMVSRQSRTKRRSSGSFSTSRSSSVTSSAKASATTNSSKQQDNENSTASTPRSHDAQKDDEDEERLDSPGAQLEESLRQSSPTKEKGADTKAPTVARHSSSQSAFESVKLSKPKKRARAEAKQDDDANIARPPESASDSQEAVPPLRTPKRPMTISKYKARSSSRKTSVSELRCYTCWVKQSRCDNNQPRCSRCAKNVKNCQIYGLTKAEADKEKADRKAGISKAPKSTSKPASKVVKKQSKSRLSGDIASGMDKDENTKEEDREMTAESEEAEEALEEKRAPSAEESSSTKSTDSEAEEPMAGKKSASSDKKPKTKKINAKAVKSDALVPVEDTRHNSGERNKVPIDRQATQETAETQQAKSTVKQGTHLASPTGTGTDRERSMESISKILPPGMTRGEYDRYVRDRANLTEEQRREQKLLARRIDKQREKESTPLVPMTQSSQKPAESSRDETPSAKSDDKVSAASSSSSHDSRSPPTTQPARIPASVFSSATVPVPPKQPRSAPSKPRSTTPTGVAPSTTADKKKLKEHANIATTASSVDSKKHQNPPFRQPVQRKSLLPMTSTAALSPTVSLTNSRSLAQVREALKSSRAGSSASTPQPASTAAKTAASKRAEQKKPFSLSDDEDDSDSDSDSDSSSGTEEDSEHKRKDAINAAKRMLNGKGGGGVVVRQPTPSETGSEDSDDDDDDSDL